MLYYELLCLIYVVLNVVVGIIYKTMNVDVFFINLVSSVIIFLTFFIKNYTTNKGKDDKDNKNDKLIRNLTTKEAIIIGASGCFSFVSSLLALKNLPLSIFIPLSNTWILFSLFFEKILLNVDIKPQNILVFIILFFGIMLVTYTKNNKSSMNYNYLYIGLVLVSSIIRAFHITYVKQQSENFDEDELLTMDYFINIIIGIVLFVGYVAYQKKYTFPKIYILFIILGTILLLDNSKNYLKFLSIKNLSEEKYVLLYNTSLIFSLVFGYFIFNEKITKYKVFGNITILASIGLYVLFNKKQDKLLKKYEIVNNTKENEVSKIPN